MRRLLVLALFGVVACSSARSATDASIASTPKITSPPTSATNRVTTTTGLVESPAPPTTVTPPTTTDTADTADRSDLATWLTQRLDAGLTMTNVWPGDSTTARLVTAYGPNPQADHDAAVLLDDRNVVSLPFQLAVSAGVDVRLFGFGDRVAVFQRVANSAALWLLDPIARTWTPGPDLGLGTIPNNSFPWVGHVDGSLLISVVVWSDRGDGIYVPTEQRGVMVSPDLAVTPIAQPPAPIPMSWTTVSGRHALLMGLDDGAGVNVPLSEPWGYDTATDTWSAVPQPDWLGCRPDGFTCTWSAPHEQGDPDLEVATPQGVVKLTPYGTVGLFDPNTWTWRQLEATPFTPSSTQPVVLNDNLVAVFPGPSNTAPDEFGTVGLLDLRTGTWTTTALDLADAADTAYLWDIRVGDDVVLVGTVDNFYTIEPQLRFVLDRTTGHWRAPTDTDAHMWEQLYVGSTTIQDLLTSQALG